MGIWDSIPNRGARYKKKKRGAPCVAPGSSCSCHCAFRMCRVLCDARQLHDFGLGQPPEGTSPGWSLPDHSSTALSRVRLGSAAPHLHHFLFRPPQIGSNPRVWPRPRGRSGKNPALAVTHVTTPHLCSRWLALKDTRRDSRARRRTPPAALMFFGPATPERPALPASGAEASPALRGCAVRARPSPAGSAPPGWFRRSEPLSPPGGRL